MQDDIPSSREEGMKSIDWLLVFGHRRHPLGTRGFGVMVMMFCVEDPAIAAFTTLDVAGYTGDGGGACSGFFRDVAVGFFLIDELGHLPAFAPGFEFGKGADIP